MKYLNLGWFILFTLFSTTAGPNSTKKSTELLWLSFTFGHYGVLILRVFLLWLLIKKYIAFCIYYRLFLILSNAVLAVVSFPALVYVPPAASAAVLTPNSKNGLKKELWGIEPKELGKNYVVNSYLKYRIDSARFAYKVANKWQHRSAIILSTLSACLHGCSSIKPAQCVALLFTDTILLFIFLYFFH